MRSKKNDPENKMKRLKKRVRELTLDLKAIIEEHNRHSSSDINRLPIESLSDSLNTQMGNVVDRITLSSIGHRLGLKKLYDEKKDELEDRQRELNIAKIDCTLKKINEIL